MKFTIYKLSKDKKKMSIKELDIENFKKIGLTGSGLALKPQKGKTVVLYTEYAFDVMLERQEQNDNAVKNRYYSYARIDKNKRDSIQNRQRDARGRPVKKYVEYEDCYTQIKNYWYINDDDFNKIYAEKNQQLINYHDDKFYTDEELDRYFAKG